MTLHRNIAINLALVVAGLIIVFYLLSTFVILNEFTVLESRQSQGDMDRLFSTYNAEVQALEGVTRDWASWDDTYDFIDTASPSYISSNLVDETFVNNRLNVILYFNRSRGLVYGRAFDNEKYEELNLSSALIASLENEGLIQAVLRDQTGRSDIVVSQDGPVLLSAMPILTSGDQGPPRGVLLMGRYIDTDMITRFEQVTSLPLKIVDVSSLPADVVESYPDLPQEHPFMVVPVNDTWQKGYLFLQGASGTADVVVQASIPRDISSEGLALTRYFFSLFIAVALVFGILIMIILEKNVLSRIAILSTSVSDIERSGDLTKRVPEEGDDELASFSQGINRMLVALSKAESAINAQNRQLTAVNEIITTVSGSDTSDRIYSSSLDKTLATLGFEMGAVFSINLETKTADLEAHAGIPPEKLSVFLATAHTIDIHLSPHERVFTAATPAFYEGLAGDALDVQKHPILTSLDVSSLAVIPLVAGSAVLGVMYAGWTRPHRFSDYEKGILSTIGNEVGNALFKGVLQDKLVSSMTRAELSNERAEKARDEANFYLDIMTHDINNVNQASLGYLMLLSEPGDGPRHELIRKLENTVTKSSDIIRQVSVIRRIRETESAVKVIDLDPVIRDVVRHYADARISYNGAALPVYADELLPEIFMNLIGNAFKFGGSGVTISIEVQTREVEAEITIRDSGPGIPDTLKPMLFKKYQKGTTSKSGKGLGLYIVRMLVERYGGKVWAEDAIPGHSDQGAAIKFTLRRGSISPGNEP